MCMPPARRARRAHTHCDQGGQPWGRRGRGGCVGRSGAYRRQVDGRTAVRRGARRGAARYGVACLGLAARFTVRVRVRISVTVQVTVRLS